MDANPRPTNDRGTHSQRSARRFKASGRRAKTRPMTPYTGLAADLEMVTEPCVAQESQSDQAELAKATRGSCPCIPTT